MVDHKHEDGICFICDEQSKKMSDKEQLATDHLCDIIVSAMEYATENGESNSIITALATSLGLYTVQFDLDPDVVVEVFMASVDHFKALEDETGPAKNQVPPS